MHQRLHQFTLFGAIFCQVFFGCVTTESTDVCTGGYMRVCNSTIEEEYQNISTILPSKEFLKEKCSAILDKVRCFANYRSVCPLNPEEPNLNMLRSADELVLVAQDSCNENSSLRQDYLKHVDCLNNHSQEIKEIIRSAIVKVVDFWEEYSRENPTEYTPAIQQALACVSLSQMKMSGEQAVGQACGQEAFEFLWKVTNLVTKPNEAECSEDDETTQLFLRLFEEFNSSVESTSS